MSQLEMKQAIQDLFPYDDVRFTHVGHPPSCNGEQLWEWCISVEDIWDQKQYYHVCWYNGKPGLSWQDCQENVLNRMVDEVELPVEEQVVPFA